MTGFGTASGEVLEVRWAVEARSVNHRGLDVKVSLPSAITALEPKILSLVRERLGRGRVHVRISQDGGVGSSRAPVIDQEAALSVHAQLSALRQVAGIEEPVSLQHLLMVTGLVVRDVEVAVDLKAAWGPLKVLINRALDELQAERDREGGALAVDLLARLERLGGHAAQIAAELPKWRKARLERMRARVVEVIAKAEADAVPEERLAQEIVLIAERADIAEELTRTEAHLSALRGLISGHDPSADEPVGKKLDFYFQELIRETNTMGSKSQSEVIATCVVEMRSEIERLREQVLNVS